MWFETHYDHLKNIVDKSINPVKKLCLGKYQFWIKANSRKIVGNTGFVHPSRNCPVCLFLVNGVQKFVRYFCLLNQSDTFQMRRNAILKSVFIFSIYNKKWPILGILNNFLEWKNIIKISGQKMAIPVIVTPDASPSFYSPY